MFWKFGHLDFEFVSDFDIRISDFLNSKFLLGSGYAGLGLTLPNRLQQLSGW
jgi:hypothetical protein